MRSRRAGAQSWVPWVLAACGPLALAAAGLGAAVNGMPAMGWSEFAQNIYPNIVFGAVVPLLGALILSRLPRHPIGWLYVGCGVAAAATLPVYGYARLALYDQPGQLPLGVAAAWVSAWLWTLGFIPLVNIGILLFPDGRLPSPRWRPLLVVDVVSVGLAAAATAFAPGPLENHHVAANPLGIPLEPRVFDVLGGIAVGLFLAGLVGAAAATVVRWRRATSDERAALSWFLLAVLLLVAAVTMPTVGNVISLVAIPLLPVAVAVSILRHNLLGLDVVVRRSLVYVTLTALLLVGYAVVVTALGAVLKGHADTAAALLAAGLVAIAFAPLRDRLQRSADRLVYGDSGDPYSVLTGVGRRLGDSEISGVDTLAEAAQTVAASLRLPYARVDVTSPDDAVSAEWGMPGAEVLEVPLRYRGEPVGSLTVSPRTPRDPFRPADLRLIDDLARQIGVAAHAMLLSRALQRSRERLVATREEERRRMRRDLHDGLGPALAGVALGLDAVARTAGTKPDAAAALAEQLKVEVQSSITDVRRLVEELRPPALDQLGLVGAVRRHAERLTERDPGLEVAVAADEVPTLPAAVEVAAYRIASEALTNVSRHAAARSCRVGIGLDPAGNLLVEVEDDGIGIPPHAVGGVGLAAMRERAVELGGTCDAATGIRGGTRVRARIPVGS
jgi:signal transduction histidine kinase